MVPETQRSQTLEPATLAADAVADDVALLEQRRAEEEVAEASRRAQLERSARGVQSETLGDRGRRCASRPQAVGPLPKRRARETYLISKKQEKQRKPLDKRMHHRYERTWVAVRAIKEHNTDARGHLHAVDGVHELDVASVGVEHCSRGAQADDWTLKARIAEEQHKIRVLLRALRRGCNSVEGDQT